MNNNTLEQIETALNTMLAYFQGVDRDFTALHDAGDTHERRLNELAATLATIRQELQTARDEDQSAASRLEQQLETAEQALQTAQQANGAAASRLEQQLETVQQGLQDARQVATELASSLDIQRTALQEQAETQARELATFNERLQAQAQIQDTLTAFDHRLATQSTQFGKLDGVLRELHGELMAVHQRVTALEAGGIPSSTPTQFKPLLIAILVALVVLIVLVLFKPNTP